jgi:hypothetical protein
VSDTEGLQRRRSNLIQKRITVELVRRPTCLRADEFDEWFGHHVGAIPLILAEKVVSNELSISFP